jgi:hypothetical protein
MSASDGGEAEAEEDEKRAGVGERFVEGRVRNGDDLRRASIAAFARNYLLCVLSDLRWPSAVSTKFDRCYSPLLIPRSIFQLLLVRRANEEHHRWCCCWLPVHRTD